MNEENEEQAAAYKAMAQIARWGILENIVTMAAACGVFYLTHSVWSFLLLLNLNTFKGKKSTE